MKKINLLFYLFAVLVFSACQQDDLDVNLVKKETSVNTPKTRGGVQDYYDEDEQPIYKLLGMPVYIINRGNTSLNGGYLTANSNNTVSLSPKDSNKNQRWLIDPYDRTLASPAGGSDDTDAYVDYGIYSFDMTNSRKYLGMNSNNVMTPSLIYKDDKNKLHQWRFEFRKNSYSEEWFPNGYMEIFQPKYNPWWDGYMGCAGSTVSFVHYTAADFWEIQPAENFRLAKLTWSLDAGDVIKALPTFLQEVQVNNSSSVTAEMTASFNRRASETSTFNKSVGSQIELHTTAKVSIPLIASAKIDITNTTSANWQWGGSETREDTRAYSFNMKVPPYTSVTAKIMVQISQLSASYVADFIGEISGRPLRISGKWEGVQAGNVYYEIVDNKTNNVLKSFEGIPEATVLLNK
ncbi:ETX/MTX2 family pore-forming toxin [uncultured Bacteroides sp.]|uniref:ETX/MTX2 family pore-forming toxin n=1 Tax=uncultured Bacteroides sp. TaxID=162156 RepID=UPI002AAB8A8B|nr:ETX/MTX2 family pore-forming toxin [uncultured Bacteroides sp.]